MTLHIKDLPKAMRDKIRKSNRTSGYDVARANTTAALVAELQAAEKPAQRRNKFNARRTTIDGITYHSAREAKICHEFRLMERAGEIQWLELQPKYEFTVNGEVIGSYTADAKYFDMRKGDQHGWHVVDVKSPATAKLPAFKRNVKLMMACHGIEVEVVF